MLVPCVRKYFLNTDCKKSCVSVLCRIEIVTRHNLAVLKGWMGGHCILSVKYKTKITQQNVDKSLPKLFRLIHQSMHFLGDFFAESPWSIT